MDITNLGGILNVQLLEQIFQAGGTIKSMKGSGACSVLSNVETLAYIEQ